MPLRNSALPSTARFPGPEALVRTSLHERYVKPATTSSVLRRDQRWLPVPTGKAFYANPWDHPR